MSPTKCWVQKILVETNFGSHRIFKSKQILSAKNLGLKNDIDQKKFGSTKLWVRNIFWVQQNVGAKKNVF